MNNISYPETSVSTEPLVALGSLSMRTSIREFKAPTTFPLQCLPMELQLLMLQHILVSPAPIINPNLPLLNIQLPILSIQLPNYRPTGEEKDRQQFNPRMIFTCKLFYREGLSLLYGHNTFMYTRTSIAFAYPPCDECQQRARGNSSLPNPNTEHPPPAPCDRNLNIRRQATNINLRLPYSDNHDFLYSCKDLLQIVDGFTNLRTLHLNFLDVNPRCIRASWYNDEDMKNNVQSAIRRTMRELQDPNRPAGALKEIVLTDLPQKHLGLWTVRQYTRLLAPNGRVGVGWGANGRRYDYHEDVGPTERDDLELLWMSAEEAGKWIVKEASNDEPSP